MKHALLALTLAFAALAPSEAAACPAGTFCYQQPGVAPVIANPKVYVVYWGLTSANDPSGEIATIDNMLTNLGGTRWLNVVTQYYQQMNNVTTFIANPTDLYSTATRKWTDTTNPVPKPMSLVALSNEAIAAAQHFGVLGDPNAIILLALPGNGSSACGQHASAVSGQNRVPFIELPYGSSDCYAPVSFADQVTSTILHELTETVTDPFYDWNIFAWFKDWAGGEIADLCEDAPDLRQVPMGTGATRYAVPLLWSNAANGGLGGCVHARATHETKFVRTSDGHLWRGYANLIFGWVWSDWGNNGASLVTDPTSAAPTPRMYDAAARDANGEIVVGHSTDNGATVTWTSLGVAPAGFAYQGAPELASNHPAWTELFTVARNTSTNERKLFEKVRFFGWSSWFQFSLPAGSSYSSPTAVARGFGATADGSSVLLDVFIVIDGNLWHATSPGFNMTLSAWENLGHGSYALTGDPDAASWDLGRVDVVVADTSGHLVHLACANPTFTDATCTTASTWDSWGQPSGVNVMANPGLVSLGDGWLHATLRGSDGSFWQYNLNGTGSWSSMGHPGSSSAFGGADAASW